MRVGGGANEELLWKIVAEPRPSPSDPDPVPDPAPDVGRSNLVGRNGTSAVFDGLFGIGFGFVAALMRQIDHQTRYCTEKLTVTR